MTLYLNVQLPESGIISFVFPPATSGMLQGECMLLDIKLGLKTKQTPPKSLLTKEKFQTVVNE